MVKGEVPYADSHMVKQAVRETGRDGESEKGVDQTQRNDRAVTAEHLRSTL